MLASIHPLGERVRGNRFVVTASAFTLASTAAGAALGLVLGTVGALAAAVAGPAWWTLAPWSVVVAGLAALGVDLGLFGLGVRGVRRQVDEDWMQDYRGWVYGAGYGAQLGAGFLTIVTTAAVPLTFLFALLAASPAAGAAVGGAFGLVRGATLWAAAGVDRPDRLRSLHRRVHAWSPVSRALVLSAEAATVVAGAAAGWVGA